jgi:hypothetical protein
LYLPGLSAAELQSYVAEQGYDVLANIYPGDGYWVNAKTQADLGLVSGSGVYLRHSSLVSGWNLVSTASPISARDFNISLSTTSLSAGQVPVNMTSMWAWDSALSSWYFYAPSLDSAGASGLTDYANSKGYQDFTTTGKTLGHSTGFWVQRP